MAAKHTNVSWEWWLQAGLTLLALQGLYEGSLLSTDVSSGTSVHEHIKVITSSTGVLAKETSFVSLVNSHLHVGRLIIELSADVDVGSSGPHGATSHQTTLHQLVGVVTHDLTVLARAWLSLVGIDHQVLGTAIWGLVHEAPLHARGEPSTATTTETRALDLSEDPIMSLQDDLLGLVPVSSGHGTLEPPVMAAIKVGEDAVRISQGPIGLGRVLPLYQHT